MSRDAARPDAGALQGVRLLDLTDERGVYGAKLLADLGADAVRVEPPGGDPLRRRGPFVDGTGDSLWYAWFASNRRSVTVNVASGDGRATLRRLALAADIIMDSGTLAAAAIDEAELLRERPSLVIVRVTAFGASGPWKDLVAPDLVAAALGGFAATTGDVDTPPLKGFGELNFITAGTYAAIGALAALYHARAGGEGQMVDAPVHEAIVSCLEHVLMWHWYEGRIGPMQHGKVLPRRGSLHWSDLYQVMKAIGGSIMITPTPDPEKQLAWLAEEDALEDLLDEQYQGLANYVRRVDRTMAVLRDWAAAKDVEQLFLEAQARHRAYGRVLPVDLVGRNPQLEARRWWVEYRVGERRVRGTGAPYHLSETPWRIDTAGAAGVAVTIADIGWDG